VTPFAGRTTTELLYRIESGSFPPLRHLAPGAPRDLETIVAHAMEVDPLRRYGDAGALADDLQRLLELLPIAARPAGTLRRVGKFLRRNKKPLLAGCVGAVVVAAALFPVLHSVQAASHNRELALEHVRSARQRLISIESRRLDWHHAVWGGAGQRRLDSTSERIPPLREVQAGYDRALALHAEEDAARAERDVVRLAIWLQQLTVSQTDSLDGALNGAEFAAITAGLGPITLQSAKVLARGDRGDNSTAREHERERELLFAGISGTNDADRMSLGLLAFLFGDFRLCEQAWGPCDPTSATRRSSMRVSAACCSPTACPRPPTCDSCGAAPLPRIATLALELADTALQLGDLTVARQWLDRLPKDVSLPRRLALDLRAAVGGGAELAAEYADLAAADPRDPTALHRLAQLAMRRGDLAEAGHRLDELLVHWPEAARFRLDRARVALQRRDLPAYARQVLAVLDQEHGRNRSRGTMSDLLEILRIGGLEGMYREGLADTGMEHTGRAFLGGEMPIQAFAPPRIASNLEAMLRFVHEVRREAAVAQREPGLDDVSAELFVTLPIALARLPVATCLPAMPARVVMRLVPELAQRVYPYCVALLRNSVSRLRLGSWSEVDMKQAGVPDDLPERVRVGNVVLRVDDLSGDGYDDRTGRLPVACSRRSAGAVAAVRRANDRAARHGDRRVGPAHVRPSARRHRRRRWRRVSGLARRRSRGSKSDAAMGSAELWSSEDPPACWSGSKARSGFGVGVAGLGDCDGDRLPGVRGRATHHSCATAPRRASVQIFSGRTHEAAAHAAQRRRAASGSAPASRTPATPTAMRSPICWSAATSRQGAGLVRLYSGAPAKCCSPGATRSATSGFGHVRARSATATATALRCGRRRRASRAGCRRRPGVPLFGQHRAQLAVMSASPWHRFRHLGHALSAATVAGCWPSAAPEGGASPR
jgi:hypothetical protein